jgi:hypothetical protein
MPIETLELERIASKVTSSAVTDGLIQILNHKLGVNMMALPLEQRKKCAKIIGDCFWRGTVNLSDAFIGFNGFLERKHPFGCKVVTDIHKLIAEQSINSTYISPRKRLPDTHKRLLGAYVAMCTAGDYGISEQLCEVFDRTRLCAELFHDICGCDKDCT